MAYVLNSISHTTHKHNSTHHCRLNISGNVVPIGYTITYNASLSVDEVCLWEMLSLVLKIYRYMQYVTFKEIATYLVTLATCVKYKFSSHCTVFKQFI